MRPGKDWKARSLLLILALLFLLYVASPVAFARVEARYLMRAGDAYFGNDLYNSRSIQTLFHQQALDASDIERYDLDFPLFTNGIVLGPTVAGTGTTADGAVLGARATANVLPFGPVNLAFPSISEDVSQSVTATQTGFFNANYNYRPEADFGNVPLTPGYPYTLRQAICPAPLFGGLSLYPEQFDTWWVNNRLTALGKAASAAKAPASQAANQTAKSSPKGQIDLNQPDPGQSLSGQTIRAQGVSASPRTNNTTAATPAKATEAKLPLAIEYFKPRNASTKPWDMPVIYPSVYNLAGRDGPAFPNPGIGTFSTNGAGSTGASLTGPVVTTAPATTATNRTGNQTKTVNATSNQTAPKATPTVKPAAISPPAGYGLTYADFNFDATTEQINQMPILERMWRNSHRGGTMGKAYIGDTSAPNWIDPYDRPNDLSMLDEHWYCLQSALNMVVPGTQIMPRFWSLGYL